MRNNIVLKLKDNVIILLGVTVLLSLMNMGLFFGGMNRIVDKLDNSYIIYKGKNVDGTNVCYALKATRVFKKGFDSEKKAATPNNDRKLTSKK
jgi:hypothetical protein